jgi:hypothetical protein
MRRPTTFAAVIFQAAFGSYLMWAAGAAIPLLRIDFGISRTLASLHSISTGIGAVLGAHFALHLAKRFSREILMRVSIPIMALGIFGLIVGNSIWITVPSCGVGAFSQTLVNAISLAEISHDAKPSLRRIFIQSGIQACAGASAIFFMSLSLHAHLGWRPPVLLGILLLSPLSLFMVWKVKFLKSPAIVNPEVVITPQFHPRYRIVFLGFMMSFCEMGVGFWAIDLLISRGAGVALGAFGSAVLSISMGIWRIGYATLNLRSEKIMNIAVMFYFIGIATICLAHSPSITMLGLVITSMGSSSLYGTGVFQVSEGFPDPAYRISRYMTGYAFSFGFTPFILALIFDNYGFIAGYLILPVVMTASFLLWRRLGYQSDRLHAGI